MMLLFTRIPEAAFLEEIVADDGNKNYPCPNHRGTRVALSEASQGMKKAAVRSV